MTSTLIDEAAEVIRDPQILINMVSKRVRQLNAGHRPMVDAGPFTSAGDIALMEIIQEKLALAPENKEE